MYDLRAKARLGLVEVLVQAGERAEAARLAREAVSIYERKEDVAGAAWTRRRVAEIDLVVP